jgi:hypothetical protein
MILCTFIVAFFVGNLTGTFQERHRKCPPPPEVKVCKLPLPPYVENPSQAVPIGRNP